MVRMLILSDKFKIESVPSTARTKTAVTKSSIITKPLTKEQLATIPINGFRVHRCEGVNELANEELATSRINSYPFGPDIDIYSWAEETPRLTDYEIVVVDCKFDFTPESYENVDVEKKRKDLTSLLNNGGVVIGITHFYRINTINRGIGDKDSNYSWLEKWQRHKLEVTTEDSGIGTQIELIKKGIFGTYFSGVKEYHKTFELNTFTEGEKGFFNAGDTEIIAINRVVPSEIVSCNIKYKKGNLIFLPQSTFDTNTAITILKQIGDFHYNQNQESVETLICVPDWLNRYNSDPEKKIEAQIQNKKEEIEALTQNKKQYEIINGVLYTNGTPLEDAVSALFRTFNCRVEKTLKGATVDTRVFHKDICFVVEIGGTGGYLSRNNKKCAQVLDYSTSEEKKDNEKVVLVANTYCNQDPEKRPKENFTQPFVKTAKNNEICLITTIDLFKLWNDFIQHKRKVEDILASIKNTNGEYKYETV